PGHTRPDCSQSRPRAGWLDVADRAFAASAAAVRPLVEGDVCARDGRLEHLVAMSVDVGEGELRAGWSSSRDAIIRVPPGQPEDLQHEACDLGGSARY